MEVSALLLSNPDTVRCVLRTHAHRFNPPTYRRRHGRSKLRILSSSEVRTVAEIMNAPWKKRERGVYEGLHEEE
jgi:hypothetical protein